MNPATFWICAALLAIERLAYVHIWWAPDDFRRLSGAVAPRRNPVNVLAGLFVLFKVLQAGVFAAWCLVHGGTLWPVSDEPAVVMLGTAIVLCGQALNLSVFARLGRTGVFYGSRLGHDVPWVRGFPFSWFSHPQYVGTVLSIWGLFLAVRFPAPDWFVLPALESVYYLAGACLEQEREAPDTITDS